MLVVKGEASQSRKHGEKIQHGEFNRLKYWVKHVVQIKDKEMCYKNSSCGGKSSGST